MSSTLKNSCASRFTYNGIKKGGRSCLPPFFIDLASADYTQPVGFGRPAILQAPLPGPEGKSS